MSWPKGLLLALATLFTSSLAFSSNYVNPDLLAALNMKSCPKGMENFDLNQFLGDWYIVEYEFAEVTKLNHLDCLGFKFTMDGIPEVDGTDVKVMISNFTFRFPPKTGFMYSVPTFAILSNETTAKWDTTFKNVETVSVVVDTDYSRWAVLSQCVKNEAGPATFQSSRILSRTRTLPSADLDRARAAIRDAKVEGNYKYSIDQEGCF